MANPRLLIYSSLLTLFFTALLSCRQRDKALFTEEEVMQYGPKGPADCFRQISFDVNEKKEYPQQVLNTFFSEQDPVKYAAFCKKINLDAVILQGVPQAGYATYRQTKVNIPYPGMKGDFFGETLKALHAQGISGFGYVGIGWVMKYAKEHPEYTDGDKDRPMICLNSPYRDQVMESAREILRNYPVDGFRFDILDQPAQCRCAGCKKLYFELFNDSMPAQWKDWQHQQRFRVESIHHFVLDSYTACKTVKPSVPIWQNWFNGEDFADISDVNEVDMSYLEFTDPFFELFLNGIFDKKGIITGKVIEDPKRAWKCLALGGRCYSYFASVGKTGLPDADTAFDRIVPADWFEKKLAPFYAEVRAAEPYLKNSRPVTNLAILYNENTRYHYDQYSRDDYVRILRSITEPLLASGNPVRFISNVNLARTTLDPYRVLLLPESSGFSTDELEILKQYVEKGGILLITGDALSYTAAGEPLDNFALSGMMGLSRKQKAPAYKKGVDKNAITSPTIDPLLVLRGNVRAAGNLATDKSWTAVTPVSGRTISFVKGSQQPLLHVNSYGKGFVYYVASSDMPELFAVALNDAGVYSPVKNDDPGKLAVLTKRIGKKEWFLHLLDSGKYSLTIDKKYCPASSVTGSFPAGLKNLQVNFTKESILIQADHGNGDGIVFLQ